MSVSVSIIIPNFNHSVYLEERIQSILNQTFQDFEIILLDDNSTDESIKILEQYKNHTKVSHYIFNQENSGSTFKQWQKGIAIAKGKYIWIAESDDYCDNMFLEMLVQKLEKKPKIIFCFSESQIVNSKSQILYNNKRWTKSFKDETWNDDFDMNGRLFVQKYLYKKNIVPNASAVVFRKDKIPGDVFKPLEQYKMTGDWLFWILLSLEGDISYISKPLNYFRTSNQSTRNHNTKEKKILRVLEEAKMFYSINENDSGLLDYDFIQKRILIKWVKQNKFLSMFSNSFINKNYVFKQIPFFIKYNIAKLRIK